VLVSVGIGPTLMLMRARFVPLVAAALLVAASPRVLAAGDDANGPPATTGGDTVPPLQPVETTSVEALPPQAIPGKPLVQLDERTAYMVGRHRLKLGILAFEWGILQQLSLGTEPPAWALRAITSVLVPNLHLKYQILDRDPVAVAVQAAGYYADISRSGFSGHLVDIPLSLYVSVKVHPRITLHAEGAWVFARVFGTGDLTQAQLDGATVVRAGQLGLMAQYQVNHFFSLTATGRYQVYMADLPLSGSAMTDPYTTATLNGQYVPPFKHPWEAIGGVAFLWEHFRLTVGAGYGYYFVPGLDIANTRKTFVPDASLAVVL
jgi:hypothetical protein